jgi:thiol-disulfide isomerase/thioredoxin
MRLLLLATVLVARLASAGTIGVGDRLPPFTLTTWDGTRLASSELAGKPVILDFWASWCMPCRTALPAIDAVARRLHDRGVVVLAVNVDRDRAKADAWLAERMPDRRLILAHDPEGALLARCGAGGMPAVYVVDRDGVVRFAESGYALDRVAAIERAAEEAS